MDGPTMLLLSATRTAARHLSVSIARSEPTRVDIELGGSPDPETMYRILHPRQKMEDYKPPRKVSYD